ncbi:probable vesicular acetylcholine transporter-B [Acanthaster planci]|uniref:Probable vesicular acetylcholine transporter-B n=1 Tax=Acanthaster planci TaxID=133434 RepID=A0A8B7Z3F1_ACAPL|nr:probable vesicular acetylcholine transporter-B [Acanthaster planci]XP_022100165.1 probable vesicular acetylcholine transporter-B [Acanthaster planci]XP_022100166.1 probable vesicular acetylcholine transporter-B [Acanthaster planci]
MDCCNGQAERWLRILTSIGALYLESALNGAVFPLLSDWDWASTHRAARNSVVSANTTAETGTHASIAAAGIFVSTGFLELMCSPIAGLAADRCGFDAVLLFGLLLSTLKCLIYGLFNTTIVIVSVGRLLQGIASACIQPIGFARIQCMYDKSSKEFRSILALAMARISFTYFAGLLTGELYKLMECRVLLIFIPMTLMLISGVLITFRTKNLHLSSKPSEESKTTHSVVFQGGDTLRWRVFGDLQIINIALCFFVADIGRTSLEPSVAVWMKSTFGADLSTISLVFGLFGLAIVSSSIFSSCILPVFRGRSWIYGILTLCPAGLTLIFLNSCREMYWAGFALFVHFFTASGTRLLLTFMCFTLAANRYAAVSGLLFAVTNTGMAAASLAGPLVAVWLFDPVYLVYAIGVVHLLCTIPMIFLRELDSRRGPNIVDYFHGDNRSEQEYRIVDVHGEKVPFLCRSVPVQPQERTGTN